MNIVYHDNEQEELFDRARFKRWGHASMSIAPIMEKTEHISPASHFMVKILQGLGRLDAQLVYSDDIVIQNTIQCTETFVLSNYLTLSYLWVLGGYEAIRTIHEWILKKNFAVRYEYSDQIQQEICSTKQSFARLRMPLAKFQAKGKYDITAIPFPVIHVQHGAAWQISETEEISRRELSNALLTVLEHMREEFRDASK